MTEPNEVQEAAQDVQAMQPGDEGRDFLEGAGVVGGYYAIKNWRLWQQFKMTHTQGSYGEYLQWKLEQQRVHNASPRRAPKLAVVAGLLGVIIFGINFAASNGWLIPVWLVLFAVAWGASRHRQ
jgi:hypothetical protein